MREILDLDQYPFDQPDSADFAALVDRCKLDLGRDGMFNLPGLVRKDALNAALAQIKPLMETDAYTHERWHNIYFKREVGGLPDDHPALKQNKTANHTLCADQLGQGVVTALYEWPPFVCFLSAVMEKSELYVMADPMARVNVMAYRDGEALNWHFDRAEFTTTLLLQAPSAGGAFEYAKDLRAEGDPNYDGVAALLAGEGPSQIIALEAGTLNVFRGRDTAHRVTPVEGNVDRMIAVFSYFDRPGVEFSNEERIGFYGRAK